MAPSITVAYKFRPAIKSETLSEKQKTDHTASIFKDQALFFNSVAAYNDPFEAEFLCPEKPGSDSNAYSACANHLIRSIGRGNGAIDAATLLDNALVRWYLFKVASKESEHANIVNDLDGMYQRYMFRVGVLCLNQGHNDILSWSHYGENHTGLAIGLDIDELYKGNEIYQPVEKPDDGEEKEPNSVENGVFVTGSPQSITYLSTQIPIDIMSLPPNEFVRQSLSTKSVHWSYEKELRYLALQRRKSIRCEDIAKLIREPFLERMKPESRDRIRKDDKEINLLQSDREGIDHLARETFDVHNPYPLRAVYRQISKLTMGTDTVAKNAIPFRNPAAVTEVIFGARMNREVAQAHVHWIRALGKYDHVKFYRMHTRSDRFEIGRVGWS